MQSRHYSGNTVLAGSKVLITGATTPLGQSCALRFAELNCRLVLLGRDERKLQSLGENLAKAVKDLQLPSSPKQLEFVKLDVDDVQQIKALGNHVGVIDVLVNLAGSPVQGDDHDVKSHDASTRARQSYETASAFVSAFVPSMKNRGSGHIMNVVVTSGTDANSPDFATMQQSLSAHAVASRHELVNSPIRVTTVSPSRNGQAPMLDTEDIADQVVFCATGAKHGQIADITSHPAGIQKGAINDLQSPYNASPKPYSNAVPQLNGGNAQTTPNPAVPPAAPPANQSLREATEPKTMQHLWEVEITNLFWRQKKEHGKEIFEGNDKEKHTPYLHLNGNKATVIIGKGIEGNPYHPMKASENPDEVHFIQNIWVNDQHGKCVAMHHLDPYSQDKAEFTFDIPPWATKLKPYEFCNMHGLWDGPEVVLPQATSTVKKMGQPQPKSWRYIIADLHRQQKKHHNKPEPFLGNDKEKHTPYISFHGNKVRVTVGLGREGSPHHPMKDSTNPAELHYITHIFILDQDNNCVALEALDPTGLDIAVSEFDLGTIPMSTSKLTPYEHCNWHGLWVGPSVDAPMNTQQQYTQQQYASEPYRNHLDVVRNHDQNGGSISPYRNNYADSWDMPYTSPTADQWEMVVHPDGLKVHSPKRRS